MSTDVDDQGLNLPPEPDLSNCTDYPGLKAFNQQYSDIHAFLSLGICFFGIFTNTLNAVVLTHSRMRSPTNLLLTSIAIADSVTMICYVAKDVYLHFITSPDPLAAPHSRPGIYFTLLTHYTIIGSHIFSTVMTVMLAVFRCWVLYRPQSQVLYYHIKRTLIAATVLSFATMVLGLSTLVVGKLTPSSLPESSSEDYYWFEVRKGFEYVERANFIIYGCFSKLTSSILITFFTALILAAMEKVQRRYLKLKLKPKVPNTDQALPPTAMAADQEDGATTTSAAVQKRREIRRSHRTTVMLVAVVVSFVVTEAPQGVIITIAAMKECFLYNFYAPIGDLLDLLVLLNSSTNFILYCAMSMQFRKSFRELVVEDVAHRLCRCSKTVGDEGEERGVKKRNETLLINQV